MKIKKTPWIKICGMTSKKDIDICVQNNVDALGFLLELKSGKYKREDMLQPAVIKELIKYVPPNTETCLLIHLQDIHEIIETIKELNPSMIQIQKQSKLSINDIDMIRQKFIDLKIIKTFYINENVTYDKFLQDIKPYIENKLINYVLLDSDKGGSGITHDWDISQKIVQSISPFPIILAGGLTPNNIQEAIKKVTPFGFDAMSGVSKKDKSKDAKKVYELINNIRL
jgi:phosphoribosylanthranilate isomerase